VTFPGGRRFALAAGVIVLAYASMWFDGLTSGDAVMLILGALGFYSGANTWEAVSKHKNGGTNGSDPG
jgi:hypothetical protein